MDPALIRAIADAGMVTGLITILIGGYREWWVYGPSARRQIDDIRADRDFWRTAALRSTALAEKATDVAEAKRDA